MSTDLTRRPPPEHFLALIRQQKRGRLKVYLGFAPGVGKTYEMLQEGQRIKRQGTDVVIAIVETHGRAETAGLVGDLEQIPRRKIEYHGVVLEELDLDAVLKRHPTVALVDELAHTNAPGSRNAKRYQDVEELLNAGIHVITTMNVQHLESLYDQIEGFTGVKVKERVPDYILHQADQVVNVDLSSEDLQERMRTGKSIRRSASRGRSRIFSRIRISLDSVKSLWRNWRWHSISDDSNAGRNKEVDRERIMVCLSSRGPNAHRLLRKTARLADRFRAPWYAIYVQTPHESMENVDAATQRNISDQLALAQQLGGVPMPYRGDSFAKAVAGFVLEYGITHIVLGRTRRPWYHRWFGQSPLDRVLQSVSGVDISLIDTI